MRFRIFFIPCFFCSASTMSAEKSSLPHQKQCKDISFGNTLEDHFLWKHPWGWAADRLIDRGWGGASREDKCHSEWLCFRVWSDYLVHLLVYIKLVNLISKMLQCLFRTSQAPQATWSRTELFHFPAMMRENTLRVYCGSPPLSEAETLIIHAVSFLSQWWQ